MFKAQQVTIHKCLYLPCQLSAMVSMDASYTFKFEDRQWRVTGACVVDVNDVQMVRVCGSAFAKMCFGELPAKWTTRSEGMRHLLYLRNKAAFKDLCDDACEFARPAKQRRVEINAKRLDKTIITVELPAQVFEWGVVDAVTVDMLRPVQQTDALVIAATQPAINYVTLAVANMGMASDEVVKEGLPKGCYWQHNRYVYRYFDEALNRMCWKVFKPADESVTARESAKAMVSAFALSPEQKCPITSGDVEVQLTNSTPPNDMGHALS
jgi:hypothetical protein